MRIITKDRKVDIPYDNSLLYIKQLTYGKPDCVRHGLFSITSGEKCLLETYKTEEQAKEELSEIHRYYYNGLDIYKIKRKERS